MTKKILVPMGAIEVATAEAVTIDYTNHNGFRKMRRIWPLQIFWGTNKYHASAQWLMSAIDLDKVALRVFAMSQIHSWEPEKP